MGVVGDGGFQMTVGELATALRLGLRVPIVVLNDGWLGLMKVKQERLGFSFFLHGRLKPPNHHFLYRAEDRIRGYFPDAAPRIKAGIGHANLTVVFRITSLKS